MNIKKDDVFEIISNGTKIKIVAVYINFVMIWTEAFDYVNIDREMIYDGLRFGMLRKLEQDELEGVHA